MSVVEEQLAPGPARSFTQASCPHERSRLFLMTNSFETGGSERQFVSVAKSLDSEQFDVHVGCIQAKGPLRDSFAEVPRFRLGGSVYGWKSWHTRLQLARHLRKQQIQIAHAFDFYTNLTLVPAARLARIPVVIGSQRQLGDLLSPAQWKAQLAAFKFCDAVICNSAAAAEKLLQSGLPHSKVRTIGNALAPAAFAETSPLVPRRAGALRVGMIARMNATYKNHIGFLRAAAQIHNRFPSTEFLLAGDGPLRGQLESEAASLGIGNSVQFLGDCRDVPAVLASLDVVVVPSDSESLSNVVLESMAAGLPVVATRVGGNPELVDESRGFLVPAGDVEALASATEKLLSNAALRAELGQNARIFAQTHFSAKAVIRQYEELYQELLREKHRPVQVRRPAGNGKLRVAIIAASLRYVGGQSVQADLMLRHWKDDAEVQASFIPVDPVFPRGLRWVTQVPGLRTVARTPFYLAALWKELRDADVAHTFSASYSSFLVAVLPAWLLAKIRGKKVLINYHSGEARDHLRSSRIARMVLKRTACIAVPSRYLVDVFREFGLQAVAVANVVDVSQFSYRARRPLRPHLVCTRGFHPYYCVDVVIQAFAQVKSEFPDAELDLVGGGALEPEMRRLVSDMKISGVNFCGTASRQEIGKYYDRADIFINASRLDNMPVSVLEAFAAGTPVISTAPEGIRYLVKDGCTGLLCEVGDVRALAANVIRVLRDPELGARLSKNAVEELQRYDWQMVREDWLRAYRSLVPVRTEAANNSPASA